MTTEHMKSLGDEAQNLGAIADEVKSISSTLLVVLKKITDRLEVIKKEVNDASKV